MSGYTVTRSVRIETDPATIHALINDFRQWQQWSPWEGLDPALARDYSGPESGVGAHYAWRGNRKAGQGTMEIVESAPRRIDIRLEFLQPWAAVSEVTFELIPAGSEGSPATEVSWSMHNEYPRGVFGLLSRVMPMERFLRKDFDKGLAALKRAAEA